MADKMEENQKLKKLVAFSEELFQSSAENIDYQKIIDNITEISGAKYAGFNLFDEKNKCYTTMTISASLDNTKKASSIIGIELLGNKWGINEEVENRMKKRSISRFSALHELTDGVVPQRTIKLLSKVFGIGEVVVAKISKDNIISGYFVLLMPVRQTLVDGDLVEIYTRQVGLVLSRKKAEDELKESEAKLSAMIANIADVITIIDKEGINRYKSPNIEKWFGWTQEEVIGASIWSRIHPDDIEHMQKICYAIRDGPKATTTSESRYLCKDGSYKWIEFTATNLLHDPVIKGILLNYRDIDVRKRAIDALQDSERKFRDYIENAPHGIFTMDENNRYIEVNKTACILTGYSEEELLGKNVIDLIAPEFKHKANESFEELKNTGSTSAELLIMRKDGSQSWIRKDATKLSDTRYLVFSSDIAEKKKAEHSLIQAKMLAEENDRIKSEFLANMSHELRTPLTTIIGFSELLSGLMYGDLNEKQLAFTNHIQRSGKHLLEIINDVLDLSKIEAGKMELDCSLFSFSETFDEMLTLMSPMAIRKKIDLTLENSVKSTVIFADELKFKQIMYNLLSNAIKFTPDNGRISVIAKQIGNVIQISVSDTGIGIPGHKLEEIFDPFTQVDASTKRKYRGTGLGLALVKKFVEMYGGKIWVESEEGKGSTFTFTLVEQKYEE